MESYQLRTFLAVARLGNITRAADQLHLTQPALSKQIKALEEELGVLLFTRLPSGMALTSSGQLLLPQAERALHAATELLNQAKAMRGEVAGSVRLGTIIDPDSIKLGAFLGLLLQYYPLIQVKLQHGISGWVMQQMQAGELDCGFYLGRIAQTGVGHLLLQTVTYRVVAPPQWAQQTAGATWATLGALPWVGTPAHSSQNRLVREMLAEHGLQPRIAVEADQEASMISLVRSGVGLCLMRDELAQSAAAQDQVLILPGMQQPCPLSFIYPQAQAHNPALQAMLTLMREIWGVGES